MFTLALNSPVRHVRLFPFFLFQSMLQLFVGLLRPDAPTTVLKYLVGIINDAYRESEHDINGILFRRTKEYEFDQLVRKGEIYVTTSDASLLDESSVASFVPSDQDSGPLHLSSLPPTSNDISSSITDPSTTIFGTFKLHPDTPTTSSFGMLVVPPQHRRGRKIGQQMLDYAERRAPQLGYTTMQIELLKPTDGLPHVFKDFLHVWYEKKGYKVVTKIAVDEVMKGKNAVVARPAEFLVFQKPLV
jgi:ribosomal protein S18 acetylase RimI-like enzyme